MKRASGNRSEGLPGQGTGLDDDDDDDFLVTNNYDAITPNYEAK